MSRIHQEEVVLHQHLVSDYRTRFGKPFARLYDETFARAMIADNQARPGATALDYGCGVGTMLGYLSVRGYEAVGMDLSPDMLQEARSVTSGRAALVCAEGEKLPFADGSFDLVLCRGVLHHVEDVGAAVGELARVLKPGGQLVVSEPCNEALVLRGLRKLVMGRHRGFGDHHRAFRAQELKDALTQAGLTVARARHWGYLAFPLCGMADKTKLMRYMPRAVTVTQALIGFDNICAAIPLIRTQSWHLMVWAVAP